MKTISYYHLHIKSFLTLNARKFPFETQIIESYDYDYNVLILLKRPSQSSLAFISFLYRLSLAEGICFVIVFIVVWGSRSRLLRQLPNAMRYAMCRVEGDFSVSLSLFLFLWFLPSVCCQSSSTFVRHFCAPPRSKVEFIRFLHSSLGLS